MLFKRSYLELWQPSGLWSCFERGIMGNIHGNSSYMKFGPVVQEEMALKEKVYGRMMDRLTTDKDRSQ